jgi:hypothetical protein
MFATLSRNLLRSTLLLIGFVNARGRTTVANDKQDMMWEALARRSQVRQPPPEDARMIA